MCITLIGLGALVEYLGTFLAALVSLPDRRLADDYTRDLPPSV